MSSLLAASNALLLSCLPTQGSNPPEAPASTSFVWDARTTEHLFNRAGFGARTAEIQAALPSGPEGVLRFLRETQGEWQDVEPKLFRWEDFGLNHFQLPLEEAEFNDLPYDDQVEACSCARVEDRDQFLEMNRRWFYSMILQRDGLRDRMTLFWHGFFTTSVEKNKRKYELIRQFQWLRANALESYADLLYGIVKDPAMLQYLDNSASSKEHPNENFARELMELYSLGEGHYTEGDVREAARALTGSTCNPLGEYEFLAERHDGGEKTILGVTGNVDAEDLAEILLRREDCAAYVAGKLMRHFEGVDPDPERLADYAGHLRAVGFELQPFLGKLFLDPAFYRDEVVGTRVSAPIEFLTGMCHKLDVYPPIGFLHYAASLMGQSPYMPPSVKGWTDGMGWMTTDAMLRRANCAGVLLGVVRESEESPLHPDVRRMQVALGGFQWKPRRSLGPELFSLGLETDSDIADWLLDDWLSVPPTLETRTLMRELLARERAEVGLEEGELLTDPDAFDACMRRFAHMVFSLPEAQLR